MLPTEVSVALTVMGDSVLISMVRDALMERARAGGADVLLRRAAQAAADGDMRLACHLADLAGWAAPDDPAIHGGRADIYLARRKVETSLMSKGIFAAAARESQLVVADATGATGG